MPDSCFVEDSTSETLIPKKSSEVPWSVPGDASAPERFTGGFSRRAIGAELRGLGCDREATKLEECAERAIVLVCEGGHRRAVKVHCDLRICEPCLQRLKKKTWTWDVKRLQQAISVRSGYSWKLVTLTIKSPDVGWELESLRSRVKAVMEHTRQVMSTFWGKDRGAGGLAVLEVGSGGNVHVHVLVYGGWVSQESLSGEWLRLTGDSPVVDIRMVKGGLGLGLRYVSKYIGKAPKFNSASELALYLAALKGRRRVHTFGVLYNCLGFREARSCLCPECQGTMTVDVTWFRRWGRVPWSWVLNGFEGLEPLQP